MSRTAAPIGPVPASERIPALDAARGVALLGILLVNVQLFFLPFGHLLEMKPPATIGDAAAWWFVRIFCEGKFFPLFSMLFGMGLVLQLDRARAAGRPFTAAYLRRLILLALFGIAHIILLWAGDILLVYSVAGLILLLCARLSARTLLIVSGMLVLIAVLLTTAAAALGFMAGHEDAPGSPVAATSPMATVSPDVGAPAGTTSAPSTSPTEPAPTPPPNSAAPATPAEVDRDQDKFKGPFWQTPFGRLIRGFRSGTAGPPNSPLWMEAETEAMRDGPFLQALLFRLLTYASFLMFMVFGFGWQVVAMFTLGAALMKLRVFDPSRLAWHRRFVLVGALVGLPMVSLAAALPAITDSAWAMMVVGPCMYIGGPLVSLAYLGGVTRLVSSGRAPAVCAWVARTGRAALSVYLGESLIASFLSYHWGLGWFGQVGGLERFALALAIYGVLSIAANLWLRAFRMGPLEWLWRKGTYLRSA